MATHRKQLLPLVYQWRGGAERSLPSTEFPFLGRGCLGAPDRRSHTMGNCHLPCSPSLSVLPLPNATRLGVEGPCPFHRPPSAFLAKGSSFSLGSTLHPHSQPINHPPFLVYYFQKANIFQEVKGRSSSRSGLWGKDKYSLLFLILPQANK